MVSGDRPGVGTRLLLWFGVLGAPIAWPLQHWIGFGTTQASCDKYGMQFGIPLNTLVIVVTAVCAGIAVAAFVASFLAFRATSSTGAKGPPPTGRMHFLAIVGLIVSPLLLAIILLSGVGTVVIGACQQS